MIAWLQKQNFDNEERTDLVKVSIGTATLHPVGHNVDLEEMAM